MWLCSSIVQFQETSYRFEQLWKKTRIRGHKCWDWLLCYLHLYWPTWATSNTMAIGTIVPTKINAPSQVQSYPLTDKGLKGYWRDQNAKSIDSLTRVTNGFKSAHQFLPNAIKAVAKVQSKDVEHVRLASVQVRRRAFQGGNKKSWVL